MRDAKSKGGVSPVLFMWENELYRGPGSSWKKRLWVAAHGSKTSASACLVVCFMCLMSGFSQNSLVEAGSPIRITLGVYSTAWALGFFAYRIERARKALGVLAQIAVEVEAKADEETIDDLSKICSLMWRAFRICRSYGLGVAVCAAMPTLLSGGKYASFPAWPPPTSLWHHLLLHALQFYIIPCSCIALYSIYPLMLCTTLCCAGLYRAIGTGFAFAKGRNEIVELVKLHQRLNKSSGSFDDMYSDVLLHYLTAFLLLPIIGTFELTSGHVDSLMLVTLPLVGLVFVPLCFVGQELQTSSRAVGFNAYSGCWVSEATADRKLRMILMLESSRPASIQLRGLNTINLPFCHQVLKGWFSYLQMLLNINK